MTKLSVAFFLLLNISLLLFADVSHGIRTEQGEYWKKIMKDEAIPDILKQQLFDDSSVTQNQDERFTSSFDPHPNAIIYHSHNHAHHNINHAAATP